MFKIPIYSIHEISKNDPLLSEISNGKILIILKKEAYQNEEKLLLNKILNSIKINIKEAVFWVFTPETNYSLHSIISQSSIKKIMILGIPSSELGINHQLNSIDNILLDNTKVLIAPSLNIIKNEVKLKKELWTQLQKQFVNKVT